MLPTEFDYPDAHPIAELFPSILCEAGMARLTLDIARNGLKNPIIIYESMVLDGRCRLRACVMAGVAPRYKLYDGRYPFRRVVSAALNRKGMTKPQLAKARADYASFKDVRS